MNVWLLVACFGPGLLIGYVLGMLDARRVFRKVLEKKWPN